MEVNDARDEFQQILEAPDTRRCQSGIVSSHKADFSLMFMDPYPITPLISLGIGLDDWEWGVTF